MEESTLDIRAHPMFQRPKPPVFHDKYPLRHMPQNDVVVIQRDTKKVYARKTDGKVYRVKVKENGNKKGKRENIVAAEVFGDDEGWVMVEHCGDEDDVAAAAAIRRKVGRGKVVEKGWDDCVV